MIKELILKNRSYRRFYQDFKLEVTTLEELVDLARLSGSGANLQSLKYIISSDETKNNLIFSCLNWAGYYKNWNGPIEGERPSGYIVILGDTKISPNCYWDHGIAAQSILLGAVEKDLGGCMFGSIKREKLIEALGIEEQYNLLLVIALGKPKEVVVLEELENDDIKYWRDENEIHHVPKRKLKDIIVKS